MRVILFGATGMVGAGALIECLADNRVTAIVSVSRRPTSLTHPKLREVLHSDFFNYSAIQSEFAAADACFFALGVSAVGKSEADYSHMTFDLTMAAATAIVSECPQATFSYVSGTGTDSTEHGRVMWARVKGKTENALLALPFRAAFMFRPGFIQPMKGVQSSFRLYRAAYVVTSPFFSLIRTRFPRFVTTSENVGRALINVSDTGYPKRILESDDINRASG